MAEIKGVLLVPEEGDPHELLKLGPCDARPPMAFVWDGRYLRLPEDDGRWQACCPSWPKPGDALVLAWDGEPALDGLDRASRAVAFTMVWQSRPRLFLEARYWSIDDLESRVAEALVSLLGGVAVFVDGAGREIRRVTAPDGCPSCGAPQRPANTPRTVYACGSSDYDQRPGSFLHFCDGPRGE